MVNTRYLLIVICSIIASANVEAKIRDSVSVVALPFRYYDISPEYIDPAPKEMCQVYLRDELASPNASE